MLNLFSDLDASTLILLFLALFFVLFYEAINGFHDTANSVATVIYTRALKEQIAVLMAGIFNFLGVILGGLTVAYAIVHLLPMNVLLDVQSEHGLAMIFSILLGAIIWNLGTWFFGIPASSSHTLIGSIIGVALANAFMTGTSIIDALNIPKMIHIMLSLILSPIVGLIIAGFLIFVMHKIWSRRKKEKKREQIFMTPEDRYKTYGKRKPPFWIRIMLIVSSAGLSFSHGANDGQKGIGLLMLVLIGIAPTGFIVDMSADKTRLTNTVNAINNIENELNTTFQSQFNELIQKQQLEMSQDTIATGSTTAECDYADTFNNIETAKSMLTNITSYKELNAEQRKQTRHILMCLSGTITDLSKQQNIDASDKTFLKNLGKPLLDTIEYAPMWIIIAVALALGVGTMIGWKRVTITIGEKIGKKGMTYAQGVSAQVTAAFAIGISSYTGMPVSTTQVLSSSVAGAMIADGQGLQAKTIKNIAWTWLLTLPMAIIISGVLFYITSFIF